MKKKILHWFAEAFDWTPPPVPKDRPYFLEVRREIISGVNIMATSALAARHAVEQREGILQVLHVERLDD
jgi:hypothetical protein